MQLWNLWACALFYLKQIQNVGFRELWIASGGIKPLSKSLNSNEMNEIQIASASYELLAERAAFISGAYKFCTLLSRQDSGALIFRHEIGFIKHHPPENDIDSVSPPWHIKM